MAEAGSPIVVGFDGSPDSVGALDWALAEARLRGAPVAICHVGRSPAGREAATEDDDAQAPAARADAVLAEGRRRAARLAADVEARCEPAVGDAAEILVETAHGAELLVVGARGAGTGQGRLLGPVSAHVAQHARCPVVVVRDGAVRLRDSAANGGRIVAGVDGPADRGKVLSFAIQEAARRGGTVYVVHALDEAVLQAAPYAGESELHRLHQAAEDAFSAQLAPHAVQHPDVAVEVKLIRGGPGPALVEASADADLLVLGARGQDPIGTALLGSTDQTVLHHAACPLVIVHDER